MQEESTHFIFDGEKIVISPDLVPMIPFLQEIEKEVENFINYKKKIEIIRRQCGELLKWTEVMSKVIKDNSLDFNYTFSENPAAMFDDLSFIPPLRSEIIVIFAYLETLFCLSIAYENKTSSKKMIISKAMNKNIIKSFIENFCLNEENDWVKNNIVRAKSIKWEDIRNLRNSLAHFFSVGKGLGISHGALDKKIREIEKSTGNKFKFISSEDLYLIVKGVAKIMIIKWGEDYKNQIADFKERILSVRDVVSAHGAVILDSSKVNP